VADAPPPAVANQPNFGEAWKAVIDFAKTLISISAALLAAVASLVLTGTLKLSGLAYLPPLLLVVSTLLAIYGFGQAISALRKGEHRRAGLMYCNLAVFVLIGAIVLAPFAMSRPPEPPLLEVLAKIEQATGNWSTPLTPKNFLGVERNGEEHLVSFRVPAGRMEVAFTPSKDEFRYVRTVADCPVAVCPACPSCCPPPPRKPVLAPPAERKC